MNDAVQCFVSVCTGLVICVPLVVQLIKYVKVAVTERKWDQLIKIVLDLMITAEERFEQGADKKLYVMALAESAAASVGVEWDEQKISDMIDAMVAMSKVVNTPEKAQAEQ